MTSDRITEKDRYEAHARALLAAPGSSITRSVDGPELHLRAPYQCFSRHAQELIAPDSTVLELGAGTGAVSLTLADLTDRFFALDIAPGCIAFSQSADSRIRGVCGDMAQVPVATSSVDVVASAGSLSYADPFEVDREIVRVLKPGGSLLVVDTMNHNPVFRLNRWINYRRGRRTLSTVQRMPSHSRIARLARNFDRHSVEYFGAADFMQPTFAKVIGPDAASKMVMKLNIPHSYAAFKFVMVCTGLRKS